MILPQKSKIGSSKDNYFVFVLLECPNDLFSIIWKLTMDIKKYVVYVRSNLIPSIKRDICIFTIKKKDSSECKILTLYFFLVFSSTVLQSRAQDCVQQKKFSFKLTVMLVHHALYGVCVHLWTFTHTYHPLHYLDGVLKLYIFFLFINEFKIVVYYPGAPIGPF